MTNQHNNTITDTTNTMTLTDSTETSDNQTDAEQYLETLAGLTDGMNGEYEFQDIEVPDSIAGAMRDDPNITITNVSKGEFGLDEGTMILSFTIQTDTSTDTSTEEQH